MLGARHPAAVSPRMKRTDRAAQLLSGRSSGVEHNLAKVGVEGSNPFARSSGFRHEAETLNYLVAIPRSWLCCAMTARVRLLISVMRTGSGVDVFLIITATA